MSAAQARIARHPDLGLVVHANGPAAKGARAGAAVDKERLQARCPSADMRGWQMGQFQGPRVAHLTRRACNLTSA